MDLLNDLAWELRDTDPARSRSLGENAYQLATSGGYEKEPCTRAVVRSLRVLAHANRRAGNLDASLSQSTRALEQLKSSSEPDVEADLLRNVSIILGILGNYTEALVYGFRALNLARSLIDRGREAAILGSIGVIYAHSRNFVEAAETLRRVRDLNRELGNKREEALALNNSSLASRELGDHEGALAAGLEARALAEETGFKALVVTATGTVAEAYLAKGDLEQAGDHLRNYLSSARESGSKRDETYALILQGEAALRGKRLASAAQLVSQGLAIAREIGLRSEEARCHELRGSIFEQQGDLKQALAELRLFVQQRETIFNETNARRITSLQVLHQVETARKDAEIHYLRTVELQREIEAHKQAELALEELAATDPLTGVLNRRKFFALGEAATNAAVIERRPLSVVLMDIDHFKAINDTHGHTAGDAALTAVARVICDNLRKGELVGRVGGDEFAVLLPGSDAVLAERVAQRILQLISSQPFAVEGVTFDLHGSLGVAELGRGAAGGLPSLLDQADRAMYRAKNAGRNRVVLFGREGERPGPEGQAGSSS